MKLNRTKLLLIVSSCTLVTETGLYNTPSNKRVITPRNLYLCKQDITAGNYHNALGRINVVRTPQFIWDGMTLMFHS